MDASSQHQVEPQISTISPFRQDATGIWADTDGIEADADRIEAPTPPPRARSRSSTPPSDHDVSIEIRRESEHMQRLSTTLSSFFSNSYLFPLSL